MYLFERQQVAHHLKAKSLLKTKFNLIELNLI